MVATIRRALPSPRATTLPDSRALSCPHLRGFRRTAPLLGSCHCSNETLSRSRRPHQESSAEGGGRKKRRTNEMSFQGPLTILRPRSPDDVDFLPPSPSSFSTNERPHTTPHDSSSCRGAASPDFSYLRHQLPFLPFDLLLNLDLRHSVSRPFCFYFLVFQSKTCTAEG